MRLLVCAALLVSLAGPAVAWCSLRQPLIEGLQETYRETQAFSGLTKTLEDGEVVLEIWISVETGSFTILLTRPNGVTCVAATGTDLFEVIPKPVVEGEPG